MEDFKVEYAAQVTSTSMNHGTTPELTLEATTQTEDSSEVTEEVMINTPEPPLELTTSWNEEPLKTPEPLLEEILTELSATTLQIDCSEGVVYDLFLGELNCIDF